MRQELKLMITDFISVNHYLAHRAFMKGKTPMVSCYKTQKAKEFQKKFADYVIEEAKLQGWVTDNNPFQHYYVDTVYVFPRIDMDTNNYWKVAFDAITDSGVIWVDDNMACERVMKVMYDSDNPRIEYTIYKTDFIGIFDNEEDYNRFTDKCKTCRKHNRNCSILKKAIEGRIQPEIENNICSKYKEI